MLEDRDLTTRYGPISALRDVSLDVAEGEVVALIGPNGAGKTTLLASVAGLLRPAAGTISFRGADVTGAAPDEMVRRGLALVPEHRRIFNDLTIEENLHVAGITLRPRVRQQRIAEMKERFPLLADRSTMQAGYLSGGQAQVLAVARALMADPQLLLMDEPSLGLAPTLVDTVFELVAELKAQGRTMLLVEQNATKALQVADRAYVLRTGVIADAGTGAELLGRTDMFSTYVGGGAPTGKETA